MNDNFDDYISVKERPLPNEVHEGRIDVIPPGSFKVGLNLKFRNYQIVAYPGPEATSDGRTEHLPLHCHVYSPAGELRINCETLVELDGRKIPKDLRKHLERNLDEIRKRTEAVFRTGRF